MLIDLTVEVKQDRWKDIFRTGFLREQGYGTATYFWAHPQLSLELVDLLLERARGGAFEVFTFPVRFEGMSGLPCRVIAELREGAEK